MAPIKVHGVAISTATQRVMACLYEKELEFELVEVNLGDGEHKRQPFLSLNPFGQIPVLEDGDFKLLESRAITQYIAFEYNHNGSQLLSKGKEMAIVGVWKEVEAHQFDPIAIILNKELFYKPLFGMSPDATVVAENRAKLAQVLDVYEARLSQSKYLACDYFTLADLHHLPSVQILVRTCDKLFESRPRVSAWVADITARPAWSKVMAIVNAQ